jgi:hypothetical protein
MPTSKHRRKAGGKSVRHPGRASIPRPSLRLRLEWRAERSAWDRFASVYTGSFHKSRPASDPGFAGYTLDLIAEDAFSFEDGRAQLRPVSRASLVAQFLEAELIDGEEDVPVDMDAAQKQATADAALLHLAEQNMIAIEGDQITVPERFLAA